MSADCIIYSLERLSDYRDFERLCSAMLAGGDYPGIEQEVVRLCGTATRTSVHYVCAIVLVMKSATLPAVRVEQELRSELEAVLDETETISFFVERAVCGAVNYRRTQAEFLARGEQAWRDYQRTGQSRPAGDVFDRIQNRIDARPQGLLAKP
jgi:hypothetical protein